mmetsp:Transcript_131723/g.293773  ORF Transcript_131723/g.293773 Transcript_131723/m.293773 type:complete len:283 (-) Transcript_131723:151-999(-)
MEIENADGPRDVALVELRKHLLEEGRAPRQGLRATAGVADAAQQEAHTPVRASIPDTNLPSTFLRCAAHRPPVLHRALLETMQGAGAASPSCNVERRGTEMPLESLHPAFALLHIGCIAIEDHSGSALRFDQAEDLVRISHSGIAHEGDCEVGGHLLPEGWRSVCHDAVADAGSGGGGGGAIASPGGASSRRGGEEQGKGGTRKERRNECHQLSQGARLATLVASRLAAAADVHEPQQQCWGTTSSNRGDECPNCECGGTPMGQWIGRQSLRAESVDEEVRT